MIWYLLQINWSNCFAVIPIGCSSSLVSIKELKSHSVEVWVRTSTNEPTWPTDESLFTYENIWSKAR